MRANTITPLFLLILVVGCRTGSGSTSEVRTTSQKAIGPAPLDPEKAEAAALSHLLTDVKSKRANYKIMAADLLEIAVYREKDMDRTIRVSQQGNISMPLIGTVKVGGMTVIEAESEISRKLGDYIVDPQVSVFIKEYGNKQVYVLGEIKSPGAYELPTESQLTVLEAVSKAGGFTPVAAKDRTKVIRTQPDGSNQSFIVEVTEITKNGRKDKDIPLMPNDVVYVPQSYF